MTLMASEPLLGFLAGMSPIILWLTVTQSWARALLVVGGGLLVMGSSSDVGAAKILYGAALALCTVVSLVRLIKNPPAWVAPFRPLVWIGIALCCSMVVGTIATSGQDPVTVVRQGLLFMLVPIAPIIGLDVGRDFAPRSVLRAIGVIGTVAAVGFATDWLARRGISSLTVGKFILPSLILPALAYSVSLTRVALLRGWKIVVWFFPIVLIPSAMLVTGTRTNLIIFLAILGIVGAATKCRVSLGWALLIGAAGVAAALASIPILGEFVINRPGFLDSRIQALLTVINGDGAADGSFAGRSYQSMFALDIIRQQPGFGLGPGYVAPMSLDTPLSIIVRFGIVGTVLIALFVATIYLAIMKSARLAGFGEIHTAARATMLVVLGYIPFGAPVEDRGFGFMLILLLMGVAAWLQSEVDSTREVEIRSVGTALTSQELGHVRIG